MKVMTFNTQHCLNFLEQFIDYDIMAKTIKECSPDIIGLNEMRNEGLKDDYKNQTKILSEKAGYPYYYFAEAIKFNGVNPYGNAIISKYPIKAKTIIIPDPIIKTGNRHYETRCVLFAETGGVNVLITHFGLNIDEQQNAVKIILENLPNEKTILMGDFNVIPSDEILKPIYDKLIDTANFSINPNEPSFPSPNPSIKIDYIFTSKDIKVLSSKVENIVASDHRPVSAEIIV